MKQAIILLILFFSTIKSGAQTDFPAGPSKYFFIGLGLPFYKIRDQAHSPLIYRGTQIQLRVGMEDVNREYVARAALVYSIGLIKPGGKPKPKNTLSVAESQKVQFILGFYKNVGTGIDRAPHYYLGGAITAYVDVRSYNLPSNNLIGLDVNGALNAGGFFRNNLNNKWKANYEFFTPLLTYGIRPNYIGAPLQRENFKLASTTKWAQWSTFNKSFRWYNRFDVEQQSNDYRRLQLSYIWDFHYNELAATLKSVEYGISAQELFKL